MVIRLIISVLYIIVLLITMVFEFFQRLFNFLQTIFAEYLDALEIPYQKLKRR